MLISKYTYSKYKYLAPGACSTYILSIVHTYYSKYLYSVQMYYSTNILEYLYLPGKSSTGVLNTIIRPVKLEYLYSYTFTPNHIIYRYTKQGRKFNQTHRKQNVSIL